MRFVHVCALIFGLTLIPGSPLAEEADQVRLTAPMVEKFIGAHRELASLAADLTRKYGDRSDTPGDDPVSSLPAFQDIAEARTKTEALLRKYDFKSLDDLEIVSNSIMLAYQADVPAEGIGGTGSGDLDTEKAKAQAEIEADKSLTPDKRQEALQQLDDQYATLRALTPLPGNADIVRPYLDRLKPIVEGQ